MKEKLTKNNQSVGKIFKIIEVMASNNGPMRLQDISKQSGFPSSTVLRLLTSLTELGYAYQNNETSKYFLSLKFSKIGDNILSQFNIRELIYPYLVDLSEKFEESVFLGIEQEMQLVYADSVIRTNKKTHTLERIGKSAPLHSAGIGKLLLLNYTDNQLAKLISEKGLKRFTDKTICDLEQLKQALSSIKEKGYSLDDEECEMGIRCVAAPIYDYSGSIIAGISISGTTSAICGDKMNSIIETITATAEIISSKLGYDKETNLP